MDSTYCVEDTAIPYIKNSTKTALIVGGSSGLGRAIACHYARIPISVSGGPANEVPTDESEQAATAWHVIIVDLDKTGGDKTVSQISKLGGRAEFVSFDVQDRAAWPSLLERLQQQVNSLDLLVNCAASLCVGESGQLDVDAIETTLDVTLNGTIRGCETFLPWMKTNEDGAHIVNVASCAGFLGMPWSAAYNAAKAGVVSYSESLHNELSPHSVDVTVVCPGFFESAMFERANYADDVSKQVVRHVVGKSLLDPNTIARQIEQAVSRKQLYLMTPWSVRKMWWFKRAWPSRLLNVVAAKSWRLRKRFDQDAD